MGRAPARLGERGAAVMDAAARDAALDGLAGSLRERMLAQPPEAGGEEDAGARIRALVDREAGMLDAAAREALAERIAERSFGLGPLEPLLADPEVDEILVSGTAPAWIERRGRLEPTTARFASEAELRHAIERILAPLGRRVDEAEPLCDARLPDQTVGTRQSSPNVLVVIYRSKSLPSLGDLELPIGGFIRGAVSPPARTSASGSPVRPRRLRRRGRPSQRSPSRGGLRDRR